MSSELDELRLPAALLVGDALDSRVPCVIVEGEAGIGKTTLLDEVAQRRSPDVAVLSCVSRPSDELSPFSSIVSALRAASRASSLPDEPARRFESLMASRTASTRLSPMQVMPDDRIHMIEGLVTILVT